MAITIDKAIENLTEQYKYKLIVAQMEEANALKVGIEGLKEIKRLRSYKAFHVVKLLPGEAEE